MNPKAPKGGTLALSPPSPTYDTFNAYVLRGNPATGMSLVFDTLMNQSLDERDAYYGLVAKKVRISADKLTYAFLLRKEARFHDGSKLTAHDAAFSLNILKTKGHPVISQMLRDLESAEAEADDILVVRFAPGRTRDLPLSVANQPIFSRAYYKDRDFEATTMEPPLGSGPYKVGAFEQGRYIAYHRVPDYWAKDLPIATRPGQFRRCSLRIFRRQPGRFRGVQGRRLHRARGEYRPRLGDGLRLPRLQGRPRQAHDDAKQQHPANPGLVLQYAPQDFSRSARARSDRLRLRLRMDEPQSDV